VPTVGDAYVLGAPRLQHPGFAYLCDSQDVEACCESIGISSDDVSAVLAWVNDGDYLEVWITHSRYGYRLTDEFECVRSDGLTRDMLMRDDT
jgi:hypothetical protein